MTKVLTRDALLSGAFHKLIAAANPPIPILTDAERQASIASTFGKRLGKQAIWIFAYGSLIWNPTFHFVARRIGRIRGYHRQFCLRTPIGRGSKDCPGLVLALERGGSCRGVAFELAAAKAPHEIELLWRREMVSGSYRPRWVRVETDEGPVEAVTFVINRAHPNYAGGLDFDVTCRMIADAVGMLGPCADYLFETVSHLESLGIHDRLLGRLRDQVTKLHAARAAQPA